MSRRDDMELLEKLHQEAAAFADAEGIAYQEARRRIVRNVPGLGAELRRLEKRGIDTFARPAVDDDRAHVPDPFVMQLGIALLPEVLRKGLQATVSKLLDELEAADMTPAEKNRITAALRELLATHPDASTIRAHDDRSLDQRDGATLKSVVHAHIGDLSPLERGRALIALAKSHPGIISALTAEGRRAAAD